MLFYGIFASLMIQRYEILTNTVFV